MTFEPEAAGKIVIEVGLLKCAERAVAPGAVLNHLGGRLVIQVFRYCGLCRMRLGVTIHACCACAFREGGSEGFGEVPGIGDE
jgi:hypothetical protein